MSKVYEVNFILNNLQSTYNLANLIAGQVKKGDIIALKGDLGVGKTAFTKAFVNCFLDKPEEVLSPTFTLVQDFKTPEFTIWHYDLYRLTEKNDLMELGLEDAFNNGVTLIEWPEIAASILPKDYLELNLTYGPDPQSRIVSFIGHGYWNDTLKQLFN